MTSREFQHVLMQVEVGNNACDILEAMPRELLGMPAVVALLVAAAGIARTQGEEHNDFVEAAATAWATIIEFDLISRGGTNGD
jgi:uncharacterized membrane protein YjjP (DUF1212 family)